MSFTRAKTDVTGNLMENTYRAGKQSLISLTNKNKHEFVTEQQTLMEKCRDGKESVKIKEEYTYQYGIIKGAL